MQNDYYLYSILSVKIGLGSDKIVISIQFPIVEDNDITLYKIVKVPYQETYVMEQCDYLAWSYKNWACISDYVAVEDKFIFKTALNSRSNSNCINNLLQNNLQNCTIIKLHQIESNLKAVTNANYILIY